MTCCKGKVPKLRLITNNIRLNASPGTPPPAPRRTLPPCASLPAKASWSGPTPRGWFSHGQWRPSTCTLPQLTRDRVRRCLANRTVMLLGDSNQRYLWRDIKALVSCTSTKSTAQSGPYFCKIDDLRSNLIAASHAFPFSPGVNRFSPMTNLPLPAALQLAREEANRYHHDGNAVTVVIHYYLHLSTHPVQVYRNFVQAARSTVQEYLKVYPRARFLIRGPHAVYRGADFHANIGDKFAHWYQRIWLREFADLAERVWYLDLWDFTIASENLRVHPEPVMSQIARLVLGYMCDDDNDDDDSAA